MKVKVKFFAILRERAGTGEIVKEIRDGSTIADLWEALKIDYPNLVPVAMRLLYAVNQDYVSGDYVLKEQDVVVFVPPVSGG